MHSHDSQLAHALASAVKVCRRSGMMQINASCQSCAKRPSALCPGAGLPSQVCPNPSICDRADSVAALPASARASYFACLMSVRFCVHSTGRTPRARHSGSPQRPSELDRETVRQWVLWPRLRESTWCAHGSRLVRCGAAARVVPTPQRTPLVPDVCLRGGACPQPARQGPDGLSLEVGPDCSKMLRDWTGRKLATILFTLVLSRSARASTGGTRRPSDFFRHSHRPAQRVADEDVLAWRGREQLGYSRYLRKKLG
jgi:hypothetical protein